MTASKHTGNYNLSQFAGTDRPTWLGDYNGDMAKIDARMSDVFRRSVLYLSEYPALSTAGFRRGSKARRWNR